MKYHNISSIIKIVLVGLSFVFGLPNANATHIVGGNLTYKYIGNERFEITLNVRRDCFLGSDEAEFDDPASIGIYDLNGNLLANLPGIGTSILIPFNADDTLNNIIVSDCGFEGEQVCVHETVYRRTVRLPRRAGGYYLAYNRCCRNASIQNIVDPLRTGASFFTRIDENVYDLGNSTPVFKQWPDVYICANEQLNFDAGAIDDDGDSLVYKIFTPFTGGTIDRPKPQPQFLLDFTNIEWAPPFDTNNLLGGPNPITIDSETGQLSGIPPITGQFLVGIMVEEYRNGELIGATRRDFQYNVRVCSDPPSAAFSNPPFTCDGLTVTFENESTASDDFQWFFNWPDTASIFRSNEENPTYTFPVTGFYDIRLIATRGSDQCADTSLTRIGVFETDLTPGFELELANCSASGQFTVTLTDQSVEPDPNLNIDSYLYTLIQGNDTLVSMDPNPSFDIVDGPFSISLLVTSTGGCFQDSIVETSIAELLPDVASTLSVTECLSEDNLYTITLDDTGVYSSIPTNIDWEVINGSDIITLNGDPVSTQLIFKPDTLLLIKHTVTLENGCVNVEEFTFNPAENVVSVVFINDPISICSGDSTRIVANPNENWTYSWSPIANLLFDGPAGDLSNPLFIGTETTTFAVTVTDGTCTFMDDITIEIVDQLDIDIEGITADCDGGIRLTGIGGQNPAFYEWSLDPLFLNIQFVGNPFNTVVTENDTIYYVRYTNGICVSPIDSISTDTVIAVAAYTFEQEDCPDRDSVTLIFRDDSASNSPGFTPIRWDWSIGVPGNLSMSTDQNFTTTVPKNTPIFVILNVEFANGCTSTKMDTITPGPYADIEFAGDPVITICTGDSVRLVNNPFSSLTYTWNPMTNLVFDNPADQSNPLFVGTSAATYFVTVTDGICMVTDSISIEFADQLDINIEGMPSGCDGEFSLLGTGGGNNSFYEWATDPDFNMILFTGNPFNGVLDNDTTTFYVRYNAGPCTSEIDSIEASDFQAKARYTFVAKECPTDSSVTLIFTDNSGNPAPGFTPMSIEWLIGPFNDLQTYGGSPITITVPKDSLIIIQLDIVYENKCESSLLDTILPGPYANISFEAPVLQVCLGDSTPINLIPNPNFTYTWTPTTGLYFPDPLDNSNPIFVGDMTTTYTVNVSDGLCTIDTMVIVEIVDLIDLEIVGSPGVCDSEVMLSVTGALGAGTYEWSLNNNFIPVIGTGDSLMGQLQGNSETFYVRYVSDNCNAPTDSITLENKNIALDWIEPFPICPGDMTTFNFFNGDPDQVLTFMWQDDPHIIDGINTGMPTIEVQPDETEDFDLIFSVVNQFGCELTDTVTFAIADRPVIDFTFSTDSCGGTTICFEIPDSIDYNGLPGWNFGDLTTDDDRSIDEAPCYTYPTTGTYIVSLWSIAGSCPSDTIMKEVTVYDLIDISVNADEETCGGGINTITPASNIEETQYVYCTINGDTLGSGPTFDLTVLSDTSIIVKGIAPDGCSDTSLVNIRLYELEVDIDGPDFICVSQDTEIVISSTSGNNLSYQWGPLECIVTGENTGNPVVNIQEAKTFVVTITDLDLGCVEVVEYFVDITSFDIDVDADPDAEIFLGESVEIFVVDQMSDYTYLWDNGVIDGSQEVMPEETTTYIVSVTNGDGCIDVDSVTITVIQPVCDETDIFIPNAFSPNGDDINDVLLVRSNFIDEMTLVIYNRWGQEIFKSTDQNIGWDGSFNGEALPPDAYGYHLSVLCIDDGTYSTKGNINLIR